MVINLRRNLIIIITVLLLGAFTIVLAAFNEQINFQGKLTDSSDQAVSNGTKYVKFLLYTTATGDSSIWSEEWTATSDATLSTTSGLFSALLGSNSSLSSVNFNQDPIYLEVQYDASGDGTYEEVFSPRKRLGAVPAAFEAKQLAGKTWATPDAIGSGTANTGAFTTLSISGLGTFSYTPQGTAVGQGSLYINPATATADYTLLGLAVGGAEKFRVDEDGDIIKVGNITMADLGWIGIGSSAGLIGFDDSTTDYIYFSNANVGIGTTGPDRLFHAEISGTATSDVTYAQRLSHITSGTAAAGFGTGIEFELENASGTNRVASAIQGVWEDAVDATEDASLRFLTIQNGTLTEAMRIDDNGNVGIGTTGPDFELEIVKEGNVAQVSATTYGASAGSEFIARRAKGTQSFPTAVLSGNQLGVFGGRGYGTTGFSSGTRALMAMYASENWTDSAQGANLRFYTTALGATSAIERVRIDDAGNVGIGTTGPDRLFHAEISGTATSDVTYAQRLSHITSGTAAAGFGTGIEFELENASGTNRVASAIQSAWEDAVNATEDASLRFLTIQNGTLTEAMRIDDSGNIGIGTTTPGRKLDVLDASSAQLRLTNTAGSVYTEFSVAAVTGDLTVSLSTGDDVIFNKPDSITGANLWVCQNTSCSELTLDDGGNLVVDRGIFLSDPSGNYFQILATSDGELWIYDASGDAVLIFDEATP